MYLPELSELIHNPVIRVLSACLLNTLRNELYEYSYIHIVARSLFVCVPDMSIVLGLRLSVDLPSLTISQIRCV